MSVLLARCFVRAVLASSLIALAQASPVEDDAALMARLRAQVMAIPEDRREEEGIKILLDNADRFHNLAMKKRVWLSIAQLYAKFGDTTRSIEFFEKAGASASPDDVPTAVDPIARSHLLDFLTNSGRGEDMAARASALRERTGVSDAEYAELTFRAAQKLITSGKVDEGINLGLEAAKSRPCTRAFEYLETLASDADIRGHKAVGLETMRWIRQHSGPFGETSRFLSNLAHVEEDSGNLSKAIGALEQLTTTDPLEPDAAAQLLRLAGLYSKAGDDEKSRTILTRVSDGDYVEEFRQMAKEALGVSADSGQGLAEIQSSRGRSSWSIVLLVVNGLIILALIGFMWARRRSVARPGS